MRPMRILLTGANGQVGFELLRALAPLGQVVASTRSGLLPGGGACEAADFDAPASLDALVARVAPDLVVNAAAWTAVDRAEAEPAACHRANAEAPGVLAAACAARGIPLWHYSTDYVFPGALDRPWREDDATGPLGVYGASKLAGEQAIRASGARHVILRTAWVYGARGGNFLRTMLRLGAEREELAVVADQVGSPTPARWIAAATAAAIARRPDAHGTWHLVAAGQASWHGFAEAIFADAHAAGLLARVPALRAIASADYPTPARRPAWSVLDASALARDFGLVLPDWRLGLRQVLGELAR